MPSAREAAAQLLHTVYHPEPCIVHGSRGRGTQVTQGIALDLQSHSSARLLCEHVGTPCWTTPRHSEWVSRHEMTFDVVKGLDIASQVSFWDLLAHLAHKHRLLACCMQKPVATILAPPTSHTRKKTKNMHANRTLTSVAKYSHQPTKSSVSTTTTSRKIRNCMADDMPFSSSLFSGSGLGSGLGLGPSPLPPLGVGDGEGVGWGLGRGVGLAPPSDSA